MRFGKKEKNNRGNIWFSRLFFVTLRYELIHTAGEGRGNNPNYSPFKTRKDMNKTVKKVLQVISYIISILLGAAGGAMM